MVKLQLVTIAQSRKRTLGTHNWRECIQQYSDGKNGQNNFAGFFQLHFMLNDSFIRVDLLLVKGSERLYRHPILSLVKFLLKVAPVFPFRREGASRWLNRPIHKLTKSIRVESPDASNSNGGKGFTPLLP